MADNEPVLVQDRRGGVLVLRMNGPEARNALNGALIAALGNSLVAAENDPDVRAVVLTGTGDRAFCSGMDLRDFAQGGGAPGGQDEQGAAAFGRFTKGQIAVPVVGAANATAVAG